MVRDNLPFGLVGERGPFIGRDSAMKALDEALTAVESSKEARIVTILGAQGVGKSRLIQEFVLKHRGGSALVPRVYRGSTRDADGAYGIFGRLLRMRFGLVESMDAEEIKSQVRAQVAKVTGDRKVGDIVYFLGQFLEVPFEESPLTKAVGDDPAQGKLLRRAVFKSFIEADAGHSPLCLVFDDLHAAHADSLELLRYLLEYLTGPILVLCAARPELKSVMEDWATAGGSKHKLVELDVLDEADSHALMKAWLSPCADAEGNVPPSLVENACSFASGNPALLDQMLRLYHDRGVLEEESALADKPRWTVHLDRLDAAELPLTVEDAIGARLSALSGFERKVLELAATMGSVFWSAGLVPLLRTGHEAPELWKVGTDDDFSKLKAALTELEHRDYILKLPDSSLPESDEYAFKHNKEREAVAGRTSPSAQKHHHAVFADWLELQTHTQTSEETLAVLAEHHEKAGHREAAGLAYLAAGDRARAGYAVSAACGYYEKGLELVGDGSLPRRIDALHNYGDVLALTGKIDDALASFREMLTLAYRLDLLPKGGAAHNRIGRLYRDIGSLEDAGSHLDAALALFSKAGDERGVASTIDDLGKLAWLKGDYPAAEKALRDGLARRRRLGDRRSIALSLNNLGIVLQETGEFGQAIEAWEQALGIRRDIGDLVGVVATLNNLGMLALERADNRTARKLFEEALEVAKQIGDRNRIALILVNTGEALRRAGELDHALSVLKQAEEQFDELGDKLGLAEALRAMGEAHLARGDLVKARECIGRCVDIFATVRSRVQLGIALRTLGEITAAGGWGPTHTKSAREYYARSAGIFEQTGNEVELAKTFVAFTRFLRSNEEFKNDAAALAEADRMEGVARVVYERLLGGRDAKPRQPTLPPADPE
ncbi:MAG: tetratricopeptide repeat protein [Polyangiaceae bacterium]|nr:tetratricopeptide repeat protein [Polyangiaceae bacterium]